MNKANIHVLISLPLVFLFSHCIENGTDNPDYGLEPMEVVWEQQYSSYNWGAYAPPVVYSDSLLIYSGDGNINCVTVDSGEWRWSSSFSSAGFMHKQFVHDETRLYGFEGRTTVFGIHLIDGTEAWTNNIDAKNREFGFHTTIDDEYYYIGSADTNKVYTIWKLRKNDGATVDSLRVEHMPWSLLSSDEKLYCTYGWSPIGNVHDIGRIVCYNKNDLSLNWIYNTMAGATSTPFLKNSILYFGTIYGSDNSVLALNANTGEVVWETDSYGCYQIVLNEDVLYYAGGGSVNALDKNTGQVLWRTIIHTTDESGPLTYWDGYVYKAHGGTLFILDANTGEIVHYTWGPDNAYVYQVSAGAGKIFVQSGQHLYAFTPYDPEKDKD